MFRFILFPFRLATAFFRFVNYKFKAFREWIFILLNTLLFLFFALVQLNIIGFPQQMYISADNISEFFLGLFQVQATVSTLGIALISIISGVLNTKYYGIQVTDYILNLRPRILKHKITVSISLFCLLLYYFFFSLRIYNVCSAIFICSVLLCIRMFSEIYTVFSRVTSYKEEIKNYLLEESRRKLSYFNQTSIDRVLSHLHEDLEAAVINTNYVAAYDDMQLFKELTESYIRNNRNAKYIIPRSETQSFLRNSYKIFSYLQYSENDKFFCLYMDGITSTLNLYTDEKITTELWTDISSRFFNKVSLADPVILFADGSLRELRIAIYSNITEEKDTWHGAVDFLSSLYNAFRSNEKYIGLPILTKQRFWETFVNSDTTNKSDFSLMTGTRFLSLPRAEELNKLYKTIIENNDVEVLSSVLLSVRSDYTDVVLANMILAYEAMYTHSENANLFQSYKRILSNHGSDFYFECIGRDIQSLDSHCKNIYGYIRCDWYMLDPRPDYIPFLPKYQTEFVFYWVIFHISFLDAAELRPYALEMFSQNMRNIYYCFFYEGDSNAFKHRFRLFLEIVLGKWNTIEIDICIKAYDFCNDLFKDYDSTRDTDS